VRHPFGNAAERGDAAQPAASDYQEVDVAAGVHERLNRGLRIEFRLYRHRFGIRRMCGSVNAYDDALRKALDVDRSATDHDGAGAFAGHARRGAPENEPHCATASPGADGDQIGLARSRGYEEDVFGATINDAHAGVRHAMQFSLASEAHLFGSIAQPTRPLARFQPGAPSVMDLSDTQREQARPVGAEAERELQGSLRFL
jgi:hypothetical protein